MMDEIKGMDRLLERLEGYENIDLTGTIRKATEYVRGCAMENCPADTGQLKGSIHAMYRNDRHSGEYMGMVYTDLPYAKYVEFGTGPKGQESHAGISPNVPVAYNQKPWWIHESQLDAHTIERYKWFSIDTPEGKFYLCSGQAAQPFMYPALKDNEESVFDMIREDIQEQLRRMNR